MSTPDPAAAEILVAEDHPLNLKIILRQIALLGYRADAAADGALALERWRQHPYRLLLTDLHMPNMDGYELAEAIRREEAAGQHTAIVAYSANVLQQDQARCRAVGMDDYLAKPVQMAQLKALFAQWLGAPPEACGRGEV